ncbi:unnamed protein product, partial [Prorocentrum cordatum]
MSSIRYNELQENYPRKDSRLRFCENSELEKDLTITRLKQSKPTQWAFYQAPTSTLPYEIERLKNKTVDGNKRHHELTTEYHELYQDLHQIRTKSDEYQEQHRHAEQVLLRQNEQLARYEENLTTQTRITEHHMLHHQQAHSELATATHQARLECEHHEARQLHAEQGAVYDKLAQSMKDNEELRTQIDFMGRHLTKSSNLSTSDRKNAYLYLWHQQLQLEEMGLQTSYSEQEAAVHRLHEECQKTEQLLVLEMSERHRQSKNRQHQ